jgi:hypothetical protein
MDRRVKPGDDSLGGGRGALSAGSMPGRSPGDDDKGRGCGPGSPAEPGEGCRNRAGAPCIGPIWRDQRERIIRWNS